MRHMYVYEIRRQIKVRLIGYVRNTRMENTSDDMLIIETWNLLSNKCNILTVIVIKKVS